MAHRTAQGALSALGGVASAAGAAIGVAEPSLLLAGQVVALCVAVTDALQKLKANSAAAADLLERVEVARMTVDQLRGREDL